MKNITVLFMLVAVALNLTVTSSVAENVAVKGAEMGKWTQDFAAAKELAKEKKLPMILNFTGSDWCIWCKRMDGWVFAKEDWNNYAKENIIMVTVDFPQNKSLVPENFQTRNKELQLKYGIKGFPTYVILESDGQTELGRLSASQNAKASVFINDLKNFLKYRLTALKKQAKTINPEFAGSFKEAAEKLSTSTEKLKQLKKEVSDFEKMSSDAKKDIDELTYKNKLSNMTPEKAAEFKGLYTKLDEAKKAMSDFKASKPPRGRTTMMTYQKLQAAIQDTKIAINNFK